MLQESFVTITLTVIGVILALIIPVPIPEQYRLLIISMGILLIVGAMLSRLDKKLNYQEEESNKLAERLKIHETLVDIKVDIRELQKEVFKNEKKR